MTSKIITIILSMSKIITTTQKTVKKEKKGIHSANYQVHLKTTFSDFVQDFEKIHENLVQLNYVRQKYYRNSGIKQQSFMQEIFQTIEKDPSLLPNNMTLAELHQLKAEMDNLLEGKRYLDEILKQWSSKMHQVANAQGYLGSQVYNIVKGRALAGDAEMKILSQKLSLYYKKRQKNSQQQEVLKGNLTENGDLAVTQKSKTHKKHRIPGEVLFTVPKKDIKN